MTGSRNDADWSSLSYGEKNERLFLDQKRTLDLFLERGAIYPRRSTTRASMT